MEGKLYRLFDFQRFQGNARLAGIIARTQSMAQKELDEADLANVSAAGEQSFPKYEDSDHDT